MKLADYIYHQEDAGVIYHGDCLEILPLLDKVDLVVTDPPYLFDDGGWGIKGKRPTYKKIYNELAGGFDTRLLEKYNNWFCFCQKRQLIELLELANKNKRWELLTWNKPAPTPLTCNTYLPDVEYIIHSYQKNRLFGNYADKSHFYYANNSRLKINHPTVKPLPLIIKLLILGSESNELILDPFLGSGTTAVAAKQLGRKYIGIEISEKYCEIAKQRLAQEQLPL